MKMNKRVQISELNAALNRMNKALEPFDAKLDEAVIKRSAVKQKFQAIIDRIVEQYLDQVLADSNGESIKVGHLIKHMDRVYQIKKRELPIINQTSYSMPYVIAQRVDPTTGKSFPCPEKKIYQYDINNFTKTELCISKKMSC